MDMQTTLTPSVTDDTASNADNRVIPAMVAARLDRLLASFTLWKLVVLISLGGFFEFYELFSKAYVVPGLVRAGILTDNDGRLFRPQRHRQLHRRDIYRHVPRHLRFRLRVGPRWTTFGVYALTALASC